MTLFVMPVYCIDKGANPSERIQETTHMKFQITAEEARAHFLTRAKAYFDKIAGVSEDIIIRPNQAKVTAHLRKAGQSFEWMAAHVADGNHDITDDEIASLEFEPPHDIEIPRD